MIDPKRLPSATRLSFRKQANDRMAGMLITRRSWWVHWAQIAEMLYPRRYRWFIQPNQYNRGSQANQAIADETGVIACRTCAAGMMSGLTSPTRPWFRLSLHDLGEIPYGPVKTWLAEVERRMMRVLGESNFYMALGQLYSDLSSFCTGALLIYEDEDEVIRCYNPALGEFFFDLGPTNAVDVFAREYPLTLAAAVKQFGIENFPEALQQSFRVGGAALTKEVVIRHIVEPNTELWEDATKPIEYLVPPKFKFREAYWLRDAAGDDKLLELNGYNEKPFVGARWSTTSNDPYGNAGPGMDALPALRQLQIMTRRQAEAIDKIVRPPMVGSVSMKNEPSSTLPGAVNYVADMAGAGFKPAFQVDGQSVAPLDASILRVQGRVKEIFFNDLFMMVSQLDTVRTATEIDARREEKLIQLGPVIERFENEVLDPIIDRVFSIMARRNLFPPPPPGIGGADINIQYISMLAEAATATATGSIERLLQVAGNLVGVAPTIMDNIDLDKTMEVYADLIKVNPEIIRPMEAVTELRAKQQQEKQANAAMAATAGLAQVGKTLSETDVGGGANALQAMTGAQQ